MEIRPAVEIPRALPGHRYLNLATFRKYGWQKRMFAPIWRLQWREQAYIEIIPTQA
jgi:hypothetical protein